LNEQRETAESILRAELESLGFEVVEAGVHTQGKRCLFRAFIDTETGITADECKRAARHIRDVIFTRDLLPQNYQLEISSPGLDRPLKEARHFTRHLGRQVRVNVRQGEEEVVHTGTVIQTEGSLVLETEDKTRIDISYESLVIGRIQLPW
jgi:ribosome maturation factor RimP